MLKRIIVLVYLLGAILVWIDFRNSPPDGLANVGIGLYTLPVFLVARLLELGEFPYFGGDYYTSHTVYFVISVVVISAALHCVLQGIEKVVVRYRKGKQ